MNQEKEMQYKVKVGKRILSVQARPGSGTRGSSCAIPQLTPGREDVLEQGTDADQDADQEKAVRALQKMMRMVQFVGNAILLLG